MSPRAETAGQGAAVRGRGDRGDAVAGEARGGMRSAESRRRGPAALAPGDAATARGLVAERRRRGGDVEATWEVVQRNDRAAAAVILGVAATPALGAPVVAAVAALPDLLSRGVGAVLEETGALLEDSLLLTVALELLVAKTFDYCLSTVARLPESDAGTFYAHLCRAGLEAGWDGRDRMLPWWYQALSLGTSGATDFITGTVVGRLLRAELDRRLADLPAPASALSPPRFAQVLAVLSGEPVPGVSAEADRWIRTAAAQLFRTEGEGLGVVVTRLLMREEIELRSPISRHLAAAFRRLPPSELAEVVERRLMSETARLGSPVGGTILGHAAAGAGAGLLTGEPAIGASLALIDALAEGLLAETAVAGRLATVTMLKCSVLADGLAPEPDTVPGRLAMLALHWYSQVSEEMALLGEDLRRATSVLRTAPQREALKAFEVIQAEAKRPLLETLAADFPETAASLRLLFTAEEDGGRWGRAAARVRASLVEEGALVGIAAAPVRDWLREVEDAASAGLDAVHDTGAGRALSLSFHIIAAELAFELEILAGLARRAGVVAVNAAGSCLSASVVGAERAYQRHEASLERLGALISRGAQAIAALLSAVLRALGREPARVALPATDRHPADE